ncbi:MAG: phage holin family protein [Prevotella sp.]|nr:phage holin family protein [Prevotella sp.]
MLSSDKNVETIAQLAEIVKHYLGIQTEYLKLDVVDKLVRLLTFIALSVVFLLILLGVAMFCSFAFAFWLSSYTGTAVAFLVVGVLHFLLILLVFFNRHAWIEKPLVRFFANLLLNN